MASRPSLYQDNDERGSLLQDTDERLGQSVPNVPLIVHADDLEDDASLPFTFGKKLPNNQTYLVCEVCDVKCTGARNFELHVQGKFHKKNVVMKQRGVACATVASTVTGDRSSHEEAGDASLVRIMEQFAIVDEPVVGLDYVVEYQQKNPDVEARYNCEACDAKCDPRTILTHVTGLKHRMHSLKTLRPDLYTQMKSAGNKKSEQTAAAEAFARIMEQEDGQGVVRVVIELVPSMTANAGIVKTPKDTNVRRQVQQHDQLPLGSRKAIEDEVRAVTQKMFGQRRDPTGPGSAFGDVRDYGHSSVQERQDLVRRVPRDPYSVRPDPYDPYGRTPPPRDYPPDTSGRYGIRDDTRPYSRYEQGREPPPSLPPRRLDPIPSRYGREEPPYARRVPPYDRYDDPYERRYGAPAERSRSRSPPGRATRSSDRDGPFVREPAARRVDPPSSSSLQSNPAGVVDLLTNLSNCIVNNETEAAMALEVSNALTQALLQYRLDGATADQP